MNVTGWEQLYDGNLIGAAFYMYDTAWLGWTAVILFFIFQFMLYNKTRSPLLMWATSLIFLSIYATGKLSTGGFVLKLGTIGIVFIVLVFPLGSILYYLIWKPT